MRMPSTTSNWLMPSVATVTTIRGDLRNRRMNTISTNDAEHERHRQSDAEAEEVRPPPEQHERRSEAGGHGAQFGLREVDHPVRAVDERQADGQHRGQHALDRALHPHPERHAVVDQLQQQHARDRAPGDGRSGIDACSPPATHARDRNGSEQPAVYAA